jgi:hypothetical protein
MGFYQLQLLLLPPSHRLWFIQLLTLSRICWALNTFSPLFPLPEILFPFSFTHWTSAHSTRSDSSTSTSLSSSLSHNGQAKLSWDTTVLCVPYSLSTYYVLMSLSGSLQTVWHSYTACAGWMPVGCKREEQLGVRVSTSIAIPDWIPAHLWRSGSCLYAATHGYFISLLQRARLPALSPMFTAITPSQVWNVASTAPLTT